MSALPAILGPESKFDVLTDVIGKVDANAAPAAIAHLCIAGTIGGVADEVRIVSCCINRVQSASGVEDHTIGIRNVNIKRRLIGGRVSRILEYHREGVSEGGITRIHQKAIGESLGTVTHL